VLLDHPALRDAVEAGVGGGADGAAGQAGGDLRRAGDAAGEAGGAGAGGLSGEAGDPVVGSALAGIVLPLVGAAGSRAGERDWLSDLLLPDSHGQLRAAGDLVLPGGALDRVLGADAPVGRLHAAFAARWPRSVLAAVGALDSFQVVHAGDVHADPHDPGLPDLAGAEDWVRSLPSSGQVPATGVLHDVVAIADLDLVADDRWPEALGELARPPLRDVVLMPGVSYTRWWLRRHVLLPDRDGALLPAPELCTPDAEAVLAGVYMPVANLGVDCDLLAAAGCRRRRADVLSTVDDVLDLLDRLGDPDREITWGQARALYRAAARRLDGGLPAQGSTTPPLTVRTADRGVVPTQDAVVVDLPDLLPLLGQRGQLRVPVDEVAAVSRVLGVAVASRIATYEVVSRGVRRDDCVEHDRLLVRDADGRAVPVGWRVVDGAAHVDVAAGPEERGRALALAAGCWSRRALVIAQLRAAELGRVWAAEADLEADGAPEDGGGP
ncbi:MAG: sacsin N-terminal ATP-binding-like domain-containing protein, partial [Frankiaceae bacterium]